MNSKNILIVSLLSITICSVAVAGPDWEIIHKAEADRVSSEHRSANNNMKRTITLLDHGPRAITTPYVNEKRKLELERK